MKVEPYLFFDGRCEEALQFYKTKIGAQVEMLMRFRDNPDPQPGSTPPNAEDKIMHSSFRVGETLVMASDGHATGKPTFQGIGLAISVPDVATAERYFAGLSDGGNVIQPLTKTFFSPSFGMLNDRFGVMWMIVTDDGKR